MSRPLRALYVDLNSFFASCEQQLNPELRGKPMAVVPMMADSTAVIAASYEAKKFGIRTGTKVGDAKRMYPGLILVKAAHGPYVQFHHQIIAAIDTVLPVHAVCSIDEIACELTGTQQLPEKAAELAQAIKEVISEDVGEALKCSVGIAPNFLVAKIACDMQKPDGLTIIEAEELPGRLNSLKLQDIPGIGPRMEHRLHSQNIRSMPELLGCSEQKMRGLWGSVYGSRMHCLLNGGWIDLRKPIPPKSVGHQHVLPPSERTREGALMVAHKLLWKASVRLRHHGMMARRMSLSVKSIRGDKFYDETNVEETQDSGKLLKEINRMYESCRLSAIPIKVSVVLSDFIPEGQHQLSFFENNKANKAFKAVDALNARYGRDTVYVGSIHQNKESAPTRIAFSRIPGLEEIENPNAEPPPKHRGRSTKQPTDL